MSTLISGDTLTDAWLEDFEYLHNHGEQLNLITTIADPDPDRANGQIVAELDDWLLRKGKHRVMTVANTIFPEAYLRGRTDRQQFYGRYMNSLPRLQKQSQNNRGTYFGRLIDYPVSGDTRRGSTFNQIEAIIQKLLKELRHGRPKRFAYPAQIFVPGRDSGQLMSFPCMSFVSFQLDSTHLCLTAMYRNQFYFQRALGNFVGLACLQRFVAEAVGLRLGSLTVHACHAEIDILGKRNVKQLIGVCKGIATRSVAA